MKKIAAVFALAILLTNSAPLFAAESKEAPKKTPFNCLSDFFSTFDRPMTRQGNQQNFWNSTADWIRNIDKE